MATVPGLTATSRGGPAIAKDPTHFNFFLSCDLNVPVQVRVERLEGVIPAYSSANIASGAFVTPSSLYVSIVLCDEYGALGPSLMTPFTEAAINGALWEYDVLFDVKYRDLGLLAQLAMTIWEDREGAEGPSIVGGTTLPLFSRKGRLKTGSQTLHVWMNMKADESVPSSTNGKLRCKDKENSERVRRVLKRLQRGEMVPVPWLDKLAIDRANDLLEEDSIKCLNNNVLQLTVDLPAFYLPVMYHDVILSNSALVSTPGSGPGIGEGLGSQGPVAAAAVHENTLEAITTPTFLVDDNKALSSAHTGLEAETQEKNNTPASEIGQLWLDGPLTIIDDPELLRETPAEIKAQKLARSSRRAVLDSNLRPNTSEKEQIDAALALPPGQPLHRREQELIWRFRFALINDPKAITKFLKSVDWSDASEATHSIDLMRKWASISVSDALELLSPEYTVEAVRSYAVTALRNTGDEELLQYLLQLVQALRYERLDTSTLAYFLVARANHSMPLATGLFWYLCSELDDPSFGERAKVIQTMLISPNIIPQTPSSDVQDIMKDVGVSQSGVRQAQDCIPLQLNLIARLRHLSEEMKKPREGERRSALLPTTRSAAAMTQKLQEVLKPGKSCHDLTTFECPCPLDPNVMLCGILPEHCKVFASKENPIKISFRVKADLESSDNRENDFIEDILVTRHEKDHQEDVDRQENSGLHDSRQENLETSAQVLDESRQYSGDERKPLRDEKDQCLQTLSLMYKYGDDLRQDQLVLQLISLMDRMLKREHLDLCMVSYAVLPTSSNDGLMEFVPASSTVTVVSNQYGGVLSFLRSSFPDSGSSSGVKPEILENFIRSCAGCMVVGHVLGIGDRHLDNFMLTTDGRLFHIDFGFAFGRDPKFGNNPPLGLRPVLVEAMGGSDSPGYRRFVTLCGEAYNILRKSARLLLSLVHLMSGSSIKDIRSDPERAVLKVQERLRLDISDHDAALFFEQALASSLASWMPRIAEVQHRMAQAFR